MNYEDEARAINLADAAGRASSNGLHDLSDKLKNQAMRLIEGATAIPPEFSRHVYTGNGFQDEQGHTLSDLYKGAAVYIQRAR